MITSIKVKHFRPFVVVFW